ncbi:MAG: hypothetical protein ABJ251_08065 [Paracoccaceae bacterium]
MIEFSTAPDAVRADSSVRTDDQPAGLDLGRRPRNPVSALSRADRQDRSNNHAGETALRS